MPPREDSAPPRVGDPCRRCHSALLRAGQSRAQAEGFWVVTPRTTGATAFGAE